MLLGAPDSPKAPRPSACDGAPSAAVWVDARRQVIAAMLF